MPSRFVLRNLVKNGIYHLYNSGAKEGLFKDDQDFKVFLSYLYVYTSPKDTVEGKYPDLPPRLIEKNLGDQIRIIGYCLMPDHYHLLVKQAKKDAISKMMKQISNAYTAYFNSKYNNTGSIFRGRYKAVWVENNDLVLQLWRYIHLNPVKEKICQYPAEYEWSSYKFFMGKPPDFMIDVGFINSYFKNPEEIERYHMDKSVDTIPPEIKDYIIEEFKF